MLSGTSMAAPVVAGAAALMLQKDGTLSPDTIKARLMISADKWSDADNGFDVLTFGAGYLNIPAALSCTTVATEYAVSPRLYEDGDGTVKIAIDKALWGCKAVWGTGISDLRAIWGNDQLWGDNATWNTADTLSSSKAVWGTSTWTDSAIWAASN